VLARDRHRCAIPGCTSSRYLDVHHIKHREQGGTSAMRNLITLCGLHHDLHHDGVIHIEGEPGALHVTHRDGRTYGTPPTTTFTSTRVLAHVGGDAPLQEPMRAPFEDSRDRRR
jgi:hypothetical protein